MLEEPALVVEAHLDFIRAGARVIILNTYAATPRQVADSLEPRSFALIHRAAIAAAQVAREKAGGPTLVAGCLPPLDASPDPGRPPRFEEALEEYRMIVAMQARHVDLFVAETLGTTVEIRAATKAAAESGLPVWTALKVDDADGTRLSSGETTKTGARVAAEAGACAVLANCAGPIAIGAAMPALEAAGLPFGGHADAFLSAVPTRDCCGGLALAGRVDLGPADYADHVMDWVGRGASIVGGCCEAGPSHIAEISRRLRAVGLQAGA